MNPQTHATLADGMPGLANISSVAELDAAQYEAHAGTALDELPLTRIRPAGGWRFLNLQELWQYRELLFFLIWRDLKVRYRQTVLGSRVGTSPAGA